VRFVLGHNPLVEIAARAERLRGLLESAPAQVIAAYLYGSRARGENRPDSDLDLALLLAAPPLPKLRSVAREVEDLVERAERVPVEAVVLNRAPVDLVHRVLRDGVIVLDRDRPARLRFEVQTRNEYFDLAPLRRLYRRAPA
jgi:predicted nucleotidyltransferase